jgi:catechol 2,3-dioxygenase-like lactoylglutathione lyase family enzyme
MAATGIVRQVVVGVADLDAAVARFRDGLGFDEVFVDPDGWAVLRGAHVEVALASGEQRQGAGPVTLTFKAPDLAAAREHLAAHGFAPEGEISEGGHEVRATSRDADDNVVIAYTPTG